MKSGKADGRTKHMKAEGRLFILICAIGLSIILFPLLSDAATTIHVSPMSVNLGSVKAGGSISRTVTIKNTGKSDLHVSTVTSTDAEFSPSDNCSDTDITPGSVCSVTVTFSPPEESFGKKTATLVIDSTDTKRPVLNVKLQGKAPPPKISASPSSVNFGKVNIGSTSSPKIVTVRNTGTSDLNISGIIISSTNDFNQEANACSVVAKGSSCTISITFTPSSPASKESASLNISSDDPKKAVFSVKLNGIGEGTSGGTTGGVPPVPTDNNVMVVTVNGSLCSSSTSAFYANKPCVSVMVCTPGTSTCETIDDILLDTGSSGLRIFQQALHVPLTPVNSGAGSLAECIQYADGSSDWGPVQIASVILGNEPAVQVPVQVIDSTFGTPYLPAACQNADQIPADAGFNGILGVGLFAQDCGQACSNISGNGMYYVCDGSGCQGTAVPFSSQVQNPVGFLPKDNNGVIVELPAVPLGGVPSVDDGLLVLGIGTEANNVPPAVTTYATDQSGEFKTIFKGDSKRSFIDTGTNGLFFPSTPSLPYCPYPDSDWFCPSSTKSLSATNQGSSGSPSGTVSFDIGNFDSLTSSPTNNVFTEIGGGEPDYFEWGLPFHFGRNIYIGLEGMSSSLGSGTYWAY
jgi:hypothetical protein